MNLVVPSRKRSPLMGDQISYPCLSFSPGSAASLEQGDSIPRAYRAFVLAVVLILATLPFEPGYTRGAENPSFAPLPTQPGISLTNGIILVTPKRLRFGPVPVGKSETNTFVIEILGGGKVTGTATVPAPFKIISGEKYSLTDKEAQVVTLVYAPEAPGTNSALVTFTGGLGTKARVTGKAVAQ